jgi:uncharacterized membrane protein
LAEPSRPADSADSGGVAVVDPNAWRSIIDRLVVATKTGPVADALAIAIAETIAVLSAHFPRRDDSVGPVCWRGRLGDW